MDLTNRGENYTMWNPESTYQFIGVAEEQVVLPREVQAHERMYELVGVSNLGANGLRLPNSRSSHVHMKRGT